MDEDRHIRGLAQLAQQFQPVAIGQAEVEDDDVRRVVQLLPHGCPGGGVNAVDAGRGQGRTQDVAGAGVVFNDKRGLAHRVFHACENIDCNRR